MRAEYPAPIATIPAQDGPRLVSLRPAGGHAPLRRAAAQHGIKVLALSPWKLVQHADCTTRDALASALQADVVIVTSPPAVAAAQRLQPLRAQSGQVWAAVGAGSAHSLHRAGIDAVITPAQMDSEGLLALPVLRAVRGKRVGLLTAPGGRGLIVPTLQQRGAQVIRADVYARVALTPAPVQVARVLQPGPLWLALSSHGALVSVLDTLPAPARQRLRTARVVAASVRLAQIARELGFSALVIASDARPASLLRALLDDLHAED